MMTILFGMVLPWLLTSFGAWLAYQFMLQNGRVLLRLESIEKQFALRSGTNGRDSSGLPVGTVAPDFELPDLVGVRHKLSDFREKNLLLIFFSPKCGFCTQMAAALADLSLEGSNGQAIPVLVTTGDAEDNRKLVEQFGIRCVVLLQQHREVASRYGAQGTPMGYRIDAAGRIASELAVGAEQLLKLSTAIDAAQPQPAAKANGTVAKAYQPDPSLARSKLNRNGLKAGALAPEFRLPQIDGGELSLAEFQGRRVLLVFSDPNCGPCDELAPRLERIHRQRSDFQVLMVSRRDLEATRAKVKSLGLTFPVVMQRQWEISLQYAMFATPIAYLIDERGILLSGVAVGVEPILALADEPLREPCEAVLTGKEMAWAS